MYEITEAEEGVSSLQKAKKKWLEMLEKYFLGEESWGVVTMYEIAYLKQAQKWVQQKMAEMTEQK